MKTRKLGIVTYTLPAYWASALINGDYSGCDESETKQIKKFIKTVIAEHGNANFVDCSEEPHFSSYNDATNLGGDVLEYTLLV